MPFLLALAALLAYGPAGAGDCAVDAYGQNGSVMEVQVCQGKISISYTKPRKGLVSLGVRKGTLLFEGSEHTDGSIVGRARIFSRICETAPFAVSGRRQGTTIVLNGNVPVRAANCRVVRHKPHTLVFTLKGARPGTTVPATPQPARPICPAGHVFNLGECLKL